MKMTLTTENGIGIVEVDETRIDAGMAIAFKDGFCNLVEGTGGPVILDLSNVAFLDSSGLGALVAARKLLGADRTLALAGLTPAVGKVMTLTRMHTVFPIHADRADALAAQGTPVAE